MIIFSRGFKAGVLPSNILLALLPSGLPATQYSFVTWGNPSGFQQEEGMSDPGAQRVNPTTGRPPRPASIFLSDEGLQKQQKFQVPVLENHIINHFKKHQKLIRSEEGPVVATEPAAPAVGESMDIMTTLQQTLRKSLAYGGLARGLYEGAKVIEKRTAQLVVLAKDCDQPDYVKLVKNLCAEHL
ncbi:hypothetical protein HN51_024603 [Arachis hypogaea]